MNIGAARENQVSFFNRVDPFREAVKAYEQAADRYRDNKPLAADAVFKAGLAYHKQAQKAEYDQSVAGQAIATFNDFMILFPNDGRIPEAQRLIRELKTEQSRGNYQIARYYEKRKKWDGALVYYNEAALRDPNSSYAEEARKRMEDIRKRVTETAPPAPAPTP
jgi:outer membrane protein assembly factor BamD (BamD/ComL family)